MKLNQILLTTSLQPSSNSHAQRHVSPQQTNMSTTDPLLSLKNISKIYPTKKILQNLTFSINQNESLCICGPNGSGKSTLLKVIAKIDQEYTGERITNLQSIGYLSQTDALIPWLNIKKNLELQYKLNTNKKVNIDTPPTEILKAIDFSVDLTSLPSQLSGGTRRILEIVRVLSIQHKLLVFDEPFNGIDINVKFRLIKFVKEYLKQNNCSLIFTSHNEDEVEELADKSVDLLGLGLGLARPCACELELATKNT